MRILIIEDEFNLADAISTMLKSENYDTTIKVNGEEGLDEALTNGYDLILLDVMLPKVSGFEILKEIKKEKVNAKVIMITAKNSIDDKMNGFNNGIDDYLTKPFHMNELLARINVQLRKNNENICENVITLGNTSLDLKTMVLSNVETSKSKKVDIFGKEFQLLEMFMNNKDQILEKEQIFNKIWGMDSDSEINTLEAYVSFIRKKLVLIDSSLKLKTIRGTGYKLEVIKGEGDK